ncbi:MAG: methyltransferase [Sphingomonas fennica]
MRTIAFAAALLLSPALAAVAQTPTPDKVVTAAIADPAREPADRARDRYRHPAETLAFFGVKPGQTVVEYMPGGGWYADILAPMLKGNGRYVALVPDRPQVVEGATKLLADKARMGETTLGTLDAAAGTSTVPAGSADVLLTFRNVHNLIMAGQPAAEGAFRAFFAALKPGGTLGVVDHRLPEEADSAREKTSGYLKRSTIVRLAEQAGFRLAAESNVNANPKDTHDWPDGVWTLPPTLRKGEVDKAKYQAIGESDRLTLKFVKPAA